MTLIECFLKLIENPSIKKPYRDLINFYKKNSMPDITEAFEILLEELFKNEHNHLDKEQ